MADKKMSPMVWVAAGCGLLSVFGCCVGSGVLYFALGVQGPEEMPFAFGDSQGVYEDDTPEWLTEVSPEPALPPLEIPPTAIPNRRLRSIVATVRSVSGDIPVAVGSPCSVIVEMRPDERIATGYWCRATAICNGQTFYGTTDTNGFFPCAAYDSPAAILGEDAETTGTDTDPSFRLDTRSETVIVRDDQAGPRGAYRIEAHIDEMH